MTNEHSGDRLRKFLETKGLTPSQCAATLGVSNQVLNNWFVRGVPAGKMFTIGPLLGVKPDWLMTGEGDPDYEFSTAAKVFAEDQDRLSNATLDGPIDVWDDDTPLANDEVYVPFLKEVELSAGSGRTVVEQSSSRKLRFGKLTLKRQNVQASEAVCVTVSGDSMEPVLPDKSTVGVDQGSTTIVDGKMYALDHGGQLRVKILQRLPGGGIRLRSYNRDDYPDEDYTAEQVAENQIVILGRVFWSAALW
ncbi:XRE family transcriptional regulator [Pseudomonas sp. GD03842]|uniref:XRE family transcriptional regulator n=1 Tax=Pseudomonas sp. GD03842 TaxID=2975385 RepID=UPI00244CB360|nr:S24 family peptidase [Pseudomonas sp. GD03842]MDH0749497.1 XRE family transcriptional regulator [Pseudomonas sp. GD03842]